jgi:hypothetical protein
MRKRLALVGFEKGDGPWIRARGDERQIGVTALKEGEELCLEVEGSSETLALKAGLNTISLEAGQMYRFTKKAPEWPSKTCVEVILNGSSSSATDAGDKRV